MKNGFIWQDTDGNDIQAHGGSMLEHNGVYYWYGESYTWYNGSCINDGFRCYSSTDLMNWKNEGKIIDVLMQRHWSEHDLYYKNVLQRPSVIYNKPNGKFVLYFHMDDPEYLKASVGIAISDTPTGIFRYLGSYKPHNRASHDMTLFQDDDGRVYLFTSSDHNRSLRAVRLSDDCLDCWNYSIVCPEIPNVATREAPVVIKKENKYYLFSSQCTGWAPNAALCMETEDISGVWKMLGNPCVGKDSEKTFHGQGAFAFSHGGKQYFAADRWNSEDLTRSGYIWLEIEFENDVPKIRWNDDFIAEKNIVRA